MDLHPFIGGELFVQDDEVEHQQQEGPAVEHNFAVESVTNVVHDWNVFFNRYHSPFHNHNHNNLDNNSEFDENDDNEDATEGHDVIDISSDTHDDWEDNERELTHRSYAAESRHETNGSSSLTAASNDPTTQQWEPSSSSSTSGSNESATQTTSSTTTPIQQQQQQETTKPPSNPFENLTCAICMDSIWSDTSGVTDPCGHLYHQTCFHEWDTKCRSEFYYRGTKCPLCNTKVHKLVKIFGTQAHHDDHSNYECSDTKNDHDTSDAKVSTSARSDKRMKDLLVDNQRKVSALETTIEQLKNEKLSMSQELETAEQKLERLHREIFQSKRIETELKNQLQEARQKHSSLENEMKCKTEKLKRVILQQKMEMEERESRPEMVQMKKKYDKVQLELHTAREENRRLQQEIDILAARGHVTNDQPRSTFLRNNVPAGMPPKPKTVLKEVETSNNSKATLTENTVLGSSLIARGGVDNMKQEASWSSSYASSSTLRKTSTALDALSNVRSVPKSCFITKLVPSNNAPKPASRSESQGKRNFNRDNGHVDWQCVMSSRLPDQSSPLSKSFIPVANSIMHDSRPQKRRK